MADPIYDLIPPGGTAPASIAVTEEAFKSVPAVQNDKGKWVTYQEAGWHLRDPRTGEPLKVATKPEPEPSKAEAKK